MRTELQVIQDYYDFSILLLRRVQQFPRNDRHGLGRSMENRVELILADLIRSKYAPTREKKPFLDRINIELEILRFQIRQAIDLKALAKNSHLGLIERLNNIGQQVGAWRKSLPEADLKR